MKNLGIRLPFTLMLGLSLIFTSCETEGIGEESQEGLTLKAVNFEAEIACDAVIDFTPIAAGTVVSSLSSGNGVSGEVIAGSISVYGENLDPARPDVNHAMVFDTDNPTGGDDDLVVPGADNQEVLIISEDLDAADPDDDGVPGGIFTFDFSGFGTGVVDVVEFTAIDTEEGGTYEAFDGDGILIADGDIGMIANGTQQMVAVNATGVEVLVITLDGSGAVDNFCVNVEEGDEGCTLTQGFWKNPKKGPWPAPHNRDDIFFLSGKTYQQVLKTAPSGNSYYQAAHQFIAASLNVANGASSPDEVDEALALGTDLFNTYTPAEIGALQGDDPLRAQFLSVNDILDAYNNGEIGPGHCDD
ncbi:hypothetical protein WIW50_04050 [Flavobacteriaceae bacterium 3-367]|uniref:hypothetical protein n=1 Tax=Eudoraea algarum TaxID=3417568 RepID=UPI00326ABFBC